MGAQTSKSGKVSTRSAPTEQEIQQVLAAAEAATAHAAEVDVVAEEQDHPPEGQSSSKARSFASRAPRGARQAATSAVGVVGGEAARRAAKGCVDREWVVQTARRVASRQTVGMTDPQVLRWIAQKPGRLRMLGGHLHEMLDARDLEKLAKMTRGRTRTLVLYAEHNRQGLDGAYKAASKATAGTAKRAARKPAFAQHKLSEKPESIATAAKKIHPRLRGKTEAVAPRGARKATEEGLEGKMRIRESGRSLKDIDKILQSAADPARVEQVGRQAAQRLSRKVIAGAGLASGGISLALDAKGLIDGTKSPAEAAENAAWAGAEGPLTTAAASAATMALAPSIAASTAALAGSSVAGTTAMAAGLATLGPFGIGIGCAIAVGFGIKEIRKATCQ